MPRSRAEIPMVMEPTGRTEQHRGTEYRCTLCGAVRWTAWANAWKHYPDHCPESEADE